MKKRDVVLLAYPAIRYEKNYPCSWVPYSLLAISSALNDNSELKVVTYDQNLSMPPHSAGRDLPLYEDAHWSGLLDQYIDQAICIGISFMTGGEQIENGLRLAQQARKRCNCPPIVAGGPHVNVLPEQTVAHPYIDYALCGSGELTMPAFINFLLGECSPDDVLGLYSRDGRSVPWLPDHATRTGKLPVYQWDSVPRLLEYVKPDAILGDRTFGYITSYGCKWGCRFCHETTRPGYRTLSAEQVLNDVTWLVENLDLTSIKFYDADFFLDLQRTESICNRIGRLGISWSASIHPADLVVTAARKLPTLTSLLRDSGCKRLLMGVESGSDRVLRDVVRKGVTREQICAAAKLVADHGITGSYTFIIGFPGETEEEIGDTLRLKDQLLQLPCEPEARVHAFTPYPGTSLYADAIASGFVPPDSIEGWSDFNYYEKNVPWLPDSIGEFIRRETALHNQPKGK